MALADAGEQGAARETRQRLHIRLRAFFGVAWGRSLCRPAEHRRGGRAGARFGAVELWIIGFTLIELMITVALLGALTAIAIPNYFQYIEKAKVTKVIVDMKLIEKELQLFSVDNSGFPETLVEIGMADFRDPWGNPYQYLNIATAEGKGQMRKDRFLVPINSDFDLYSMGPDGRTTSPLTAKISRDDIIRGSDGRYFGVASAY